MAVDLRDISVVGQKPIEILNVGDEIQYLKAVTDWKRKSVSRTGKPLSLYAFPGTRVVQFPDGNVKVIQWTSKRGAHFVPFESYKNSLIKEARIPKQIINKIKAAEGQLTIPGTGVKPIPHGAGEGFAKWFAKDIMGEQLTEKDFWNRLGKLYQEYGYEPKKWRSSVSKDLSHFHPRSEGGRFTFVEHWLVNQSRGAKTFIPLGNLRQAQIPVTYEDLFDHYSKYVIGNEPKPWYGELNNLNLDDINALARGNGVPEVVTRRNDINRILTQALGGESVSSDTFLQLNDDYIRLIQESRGIDYLTADNSNINLEADAKFMSKHQGQGTGFRPLEGGYESPDGSSRGYDVDVDQGGPKADIKGRHILSGGLTIGGLTSGIGKTIAAEAPLSPINSETAYNVGEGLATYQDTGEVDMANVQGALSGMGKEIIGGAITGGGIRAGLKAAATKGATHFGAKSLVGKAVPYVGWGLLAYGIYDTADAFVKGYTNKGITERIQEVDYESIINEAFSPENSPFKQAQLPM
tara:strand:+ start:67 stop:1632 length:1566 start_codon:yes stop_codon:yes gene_type:complete